MLRPAIYIYICIYRYSYPLPQVILGGKKKRRKGIEQEVIILGDYD